MTQPAPTSADARGDDERSASDGGGESGRRDVHVGRDGWLFLTGGGNAALDQYRSRPGDRRHLWGWRRLIERRALRCLRLGITFLQVVVPEKLTVYDDRVGDLAYDPSVAPVRRIARWLRGSPARGRFVDLVTPLRAARDEAQLYMRTDSHWSPDGAAVAYRVLCRRLGVVPRDDLTALRGAAIEVVGDLGKKLVPPVGETVRPVLLPRDAVRRHANRLVARHEADGTVAALHSGVHVVFRNPSPDADPRTLVLFGDSCAHFLPSVPTGALTPLLAESFREVHFLWSASVDWDYVREARPQIVICETAERFTRRLPPWSFRHEILEEIALRRHAPARPRAEPTRFAPVRVGHPDVHEGEDGWLFLIGGANRVLAQYSRTPAQRLSTLRWARRIASRRRRARRLGIRYLHVVVPEKLTIYEHRVGDLPLDLYAAPAIRLDLTLSRHRAADSWIDLVMPLRIARDDEDLYLRTDTHWRFAGCRIAAETILKACGATPDPTLADRPFVEILHAGDLGAKLDPPRAERLRNHTILRNAVRIRANAPIERHEAAGTADRLHVGASAVFRNEAPSADPRTLMIFGDSCAHFGPIGLTAALAESFREVHFVWSSSLDWRHIERVKPDLLLVEMAERFLARIPDDRYRTPA